MQAMRYGGRCTLPIEFDAREAPVKLTCSMESRCHNQLS